MGQIRWIAGFLTLLSVARYSYSDDARYTEPAALKNLGHSHKIRLIYFVPEDRKPIKKYRDKITTLMQFVNHIYRSDLRGKGIETDGLDFEFKKNKPVVHLIRGKHGSDHYSGAPNHNRQQQWRTVHPEVEAELGPPKNFVHLVFAETYDDGPAKYEWPGAFAHAAQLSPDSGAAIMTSWILRDELCATNVRNQLKYLFDPTPIKGRVALGHGRMDSPRFEFIEDGYGAVIHELGHAFGLPHDLRDGTSIMGNGFRQCQNNFDTQATNKPSTFSQDNTRILQYSRFLNPNPNIEDNKIPEFTLSLPQTPKPGDTQIKFSIALNDDVGLGAVLYTDQDDNVTGGQAVEGKEVTVVGFAQRQPLKAGDQYVLTVRAIDRAGNIAKATLKHTVQ